MPFISRKTINGKQRYYLEQSVRLPNGTIKKYSQYLKDYAPKKKQYAMQPALASLQAHIAKGLATAAASLYKKDTIFDELTIQRLEEIKLGYRDIRKKLNTKQLQDIIDRFAVNFTYESNAIEGNSLTLKDVTFLFFEKSVTKGKELRDIYEALNTRNALKRVFHKKLKMTEKDIIRLHKMLIEHTGVATGYKQLPNFLLGKSVQTVPPEHVSQEMKRLLTWYVHNTHMHPIQRAAYVHGVFERIHPFEDGNGRVGRLLINIILISCGYPPLIIRKTQRIAYFKALEAFDHGHHDKLYRFLIEKYKQTYEQFFKVYVQYLK